jgi:hypothetical protein
MIFDDTKDLLQKSEEVILRIDNSKNRFIDKIGKIWDNSTLDFICAGSNFSLFIKTVIIATIFWILLSLILFIQNNLSEMTTVKLIVNAIFALVAALICSPLIIPSKSLDNDIKGKDIELIHKKIIEKQLPELERQTIKDNLRMMEATFKSKVSMSRAMITILWAIYLYFLTNHFLPIFMKGEPVLIINLLLVILSFFFILMFHLAERTFSRTGRKIFMTLFFALNEPNNCRKGNFSRLSGSFNRRKLTQCQNKKYVKFAKG